MHRVLWLPTHPTAGAMSMDRYWRELDLQRRLNAGREGGVEIICPLGSPPAHSREAKRPVRAWQKYYHYPWLVRRMAQQGVSTMHVLDHSRLVSALRFVLLGGRPSTRIHADS